MRVRVRCGADGTYVYFLRHRKQTKPRDRQAYFGRAGRLAATSNETFSAVAFHGASNDIRDPPAPMPAWQVWTKALNRKGTAQAVLVRNYNARGRRVSPRP